MCNKRYEIRHRKLWGLMGGDSDPDNLPIVWSYFKKRANSVPAIYSYNLAPIPESDFEILYDVDKAIGQLTDKLFTKKLTKLRNGKKVRKTFRKEFSDHDWSKDLQGSYRYLALMHYLRQCKQEGSKKCLLSKVEYGLLQPKLTKKQKVDKTLGKVLISY